MTIENTIMNWSILVIVTVLLFGLVSCNETSTSALFQKLSIEESGITFSNNLEETDSLNIIQYLYFYNGSGLAAGDINGDGLADLFFGSNQGMSKLYINSSSDNKIQFKDITVEAGLNNLSGWTTGVSIVDVNGDNKLDIFICQVNYKNLKGHNRLYINTSSSQSDISFSDQTEEYGLSFSGLSTQAAFFDYDLDGDLDMYLLNHSVHDAENYSKSDIRYTHDDNGDRLYKNEGNRFMDVTQEANILNSKIGFGLGMAISDLNNDGWPDIYIGNDFHENDYLYINNQDGTFRNTSKESMGHTSQFTMGVDIADFDNDGLMDVLSLDMMPENESVKRSSVPSDNYNIYNFKNSFGYHFQAPHNNLQRNRGTDQLGIPRFSEISELMKIEDTDWSWSGLIADFDNDGWKDVFVTNGIARRPNDLDYLNYISNPLVQQQASDKTMIEKMPEGRVANYLFKNNRGEDFQNISNSISSNQPSISTSSVYADFDNDGDLDIAVSNINEAASILVNNSTNNYVTVHLNGDRENQQAIGARVEIFNDGKRWVQEKYLTHGFMSSTNVDMVFGIGESESIDSVIVRWPNQKISRLLNPDVNSKMEISSINASLNSENREIRKTLFEVIDSLLDFRHKENDFIDTDIEKLIPWMLSTQGPALAIADVNGDSRDDVFIGGAMGQSPALFIQSSAGGMARLEQEIFLKEYYYEDVDALFVDVDEDGDLDLYVVSGGNEELSDSPRLLDRIYLNDGKGVFSRSLNALPLITENGSSVRAADYDGDGDLDLITGSLVLARNYGLSKGAQVLVNIDKGKYQEGTNQLAPELNNLGMVTAVSWSDIDNDGDQDIVIAGEWMPLTIMENDKGRFKKIIVEKSIGLWRTLVVADIDGDGLQDVVAGNFGTNTYMAYAESLGIYVGDFDNNVVTEPLLFYKKENERHPLASKDLLTSQMNYFKNLHKDYHSFSVATFDEMFGPVLNKNFMTTEIEEFETCWYKNLGDNKFKKQSLPLDVQYAPVFSLIVDDFNKDGHQDILAMGNYYEVSPYIGRADASYGTVSLGSGNGEFTSMTPQESGLLISGQVRHALPITIHGSKGILIARNNDTPIYLKYNDNE